MGSENNTLIGDSLLKIVRQIKRKHWMFSAEFE